MTEKFNEVVEGLKEAGYQGKIALTAFFPTKDGGPGQWRPLTKFLDIDNAEFEFDEVLQDYWGNHQYLHFPDSFQMFQIQNDCFYNCLHEVVPKELETAFESPETLKSSLKIGRCAYVKVSHIKEIESKLKDVRINVQSEKQAIDDKKYNVAKGVSVKEKPHMIFKYIPDDPKNVEYFDGKKIRRMSYEDICISLILFKCSKYSSNQTVSK